MSKYDVSFSRLAVLLLPMCLRKPGVAALCRAVTAPVGRLHTELMRFRDDMNYRMRHNGQTCKLRAVLNDCFDNNQRRIRIAEYYDGSVQGISLHKRETNLFVRIPHRTSGRKLVYRRGYNGALGYGFWIEIPSELHGIVSELELRAVADKYKLASIRYSISYYQA